MAPIKNIVNTNIWEPALTLQAHAIVSVGCVSFGETCVGSALSVCHNFCVTCCKNFVSASMWIFSGSKLSPSYVDQLIQSKKHKIKDQN